MEYIIPHDLIGKDVWVKDPNTLSEEEGSYYRKEGAKFVMNDELSDKDCAFLVSQGVRLVPKAQPKKVKESKKTKEKE